MTTKTRPTLIHEEFMRQELNGRFVRRFYPQANAGHPPFSEFFEVWRVEHEGTFAIAIVQVFAGAEADGDNGFDVFIQAASRNSHNATRDAVRRHIEVSHG